MRRRGRNLTGLALGVATALYVFWVYGSLLLGVEMPWLFSWLMLVGWWQILLNVLDELSGSGPQIAMILGGIMGLAIGLHLLLRFLAKTNLVKLPAWKAGWFVSGGGCLLMAGLCSLGLFTQWHWWNTTSQRRLVTGFERFPQYHRHSLEYSGAAAGRYLAEQRELPAGCTVSETGELLHGWMTQVLPYLASTDASNLYSRVNWELPWHDQRHHKVFAFPLLPFQLSGTEYNLPSHDDRGYALTEISANVHVISGPRRTSLAQIPDGISQTILMGEAYTSRKPWGDATNWRDPVMGVNASASGFTAPWADRGVQFVMVDGSVRFISEDIDPAVLEALATPAGQESEAGL